MSLDAIIGLDRWTDQFAFAAGGGGWDPDRPVTNLGSMPLYRVGRTATGNADDTVFVATSTSPLPVGLMAFVGHNADDDDTFEIEMFGDPGMAPSTLVHHEDPADFWPVVYDRSALPFEHESFWTGKYSARQRARKRTPIRPVYLPSPVLVQAIRVRVRKINPSAGPFQCRLFEIAMGHQVSISPALGLNYGFGFRTTAVQAECGHKEFNRLPKPQIWRGRIPYLPVDEARQRMHDALEDYDLDVPFLFFPFPDRTVDWLRMVQLVRNLDPGLFGVVGHQHDEVPFSFEGVL
ncbi:hypothetical protein J2847_006795 [Azospirillum agricola]|uniref:hypothetical protein n=1 Tax=Azospirillum agricola TaxID=1720247 RepID=UPI001AE18BC5|nr:hypothetical protein [Azospirillum agricola]MBP2233457.1 hypothetical protein [Azospirillum agricola]